MADAVVLSQLLSRLAALLAPVLGGPVDVAEPPDAELFSFALRRHQVGPLLYGAVLRSGAAVPQPLLDRLAASYRDSAARRAAALARLERIAGAFGALGIDWMAIKGTIQAERLYADPAWRDSADIDILVSPAQFGAAAAALAGLGYIAINPPLPREGPLRKAILAPVRDISFVAQDDVRCAVELHRRLFFASDARAQSIGLRPASGRIPAPAPGPELVLYLILHGAMCFWVRLKWLADLAPLLARLDAGQLAAVATMARRAGSGHSLAASLILLRMVFPFVALGPLEPLLERPGPPVRRRLSRYLAMINRDGDWRASPLDNARLALLSQWLVFESPASRVNILATAPLSNLTRKLAAALGDRHSLPADWATPPP